MSVRTLFLTEAIYEYMTAVSSREPDALRELRHASSKLEGHHRQRRAHPGEETMRVIQCGCYVVPSVTQTVASRNHAWVAVT